MKVTRNFRSIIPLDRAKEDYSDLSFSKEQMLTVDFQLLDDTPRSIFSDYLQNLVCFTYLKTSLSLLH